MHDHPFFGGGKRLAFAHRGGATAAPENTLAAFRAAVEMGFTHLETDVHVSSDGVLVAFHDDDLTRTCGDPRRIATTEWSDIAQLHVAGKEPIPRLEDVVEACPDAFLNIDCKTDAAVTPLVRFLRENKYLLDRVCIGSFSDDRLDRIREEFGGAVLTSMGPRAVARLVAASRVSALDLRKDGAACAQIPMKQGPIPVLTRRLLETAHDRNLFVHVWTVDDRDTIDRLFSMGVDGVMSDDLNALREVMESQGHW